MARPRPKPGGGKKYVKPDDKPMAVKNFCISKHVSEGRGKKIFTYSKTGMGKTTLASMAPDNVFICPDEGLDEDFVIPTTGEEPDVINDIETFQDLRDCLHSKSVMESKQTLSLDTITYVQSMCDVHCVANVSKEKGGKAKSITDYGYGRGYEHVYNNMRLLQVDLDELVRADKNVHLLGQAELYDKVDATYGNHWFAQPALYDKKNSRVCAMYLAWASYIFKIDWEAVEIDNKVGTATDTRAIFVKPEYSFEAKSRGHVFKDVSVVSFKHEADNTIWRMLFDGYNPNEG